MNRHPPKKYTLQPVFEPLKNIVQSVIGDIRWNHQKNPPSRPALDITVDPRLAASIEWDIYFITNRRQEEQILIRNFGDEVEATNARKVLNMVFYPHELKAMIAEQHGQEVRIR